MWRGRSEQPDDGAAAGQARRQATGRGPGRPRDVETEARILDTTMQLLGQLGYNGMSIEAVAAEAGVGKTTVYRRWSNKGKMVVSTLVKHADVRQVHLPPDGDLRTDLRCLVEFAVGVMRQAAARNTMAGLANDTVVDEHVAEAFQEQCVSRKREKVQEILDRAVKRGEVEPGIDADLVIDQLFGAAMYRGLFAGRPLDDAFCASLTERLALSVERVVPGR